MSAASLACATPLLELPRLARGLEAQLFGKLEASGPTGSLKDRICAAMVEAAEREGRLRPDGTLVEATSGNTGIALAALGAARGYRVVLTMPETVSSSHQALLRLYGAELVLTPGSLMRPAVEQARALLSRIPGAVWLDQFANPANPEAHRRTTAVELWEQCGGELDVFVAGVGTGGTITGVGGLLKQRRPGVKVVAVEPAGCAVLSGGRPGHHVVRGLGAGFVPAVLDRGVIDEVLRVRDADAFANARRLAREEGLAVGPSSGAALAAALELARRPQMAGKRIVVMLADGGERYLADPAGAGLLGEL